METKFRFKFAVKRRETVRPRERFDSIVSIEPFRPAFSRNPIYRSVRGKCCSAASPANNAISRRDSSLCETNKPRSNSLSRITL